MNEINNNEEKLIPINGSNIRPAISFKENIISHIGRLALNFLNFLYQNLKSSVIGAVGIVLIALSQVEIGLLLVVIAVVLLVINYFKGNYTRKLLEIDSKEDSINVCENLKTTSIEKGFYIGEKDLEFNNFSELSSFIDKFLEFSKPAIEEPTKYFYTDIHFVEYIIDLVKAIQELVKKSTVNSYQKNLDYCNKKINQLIKDFHKELDGKIRSQKEHMMILKELSSAKNKLNL